MSAALDPTAVEQDVLRALRAGEEPAQPSPSGEPLALAEWLRFGLFSVLDASRTLRQHVEEVRAQATLKADGSPVTRLEAEVEERIRRRLAALDPAVAFVGEEGGGALPSGGDAVAVDPVDGTWAFLAQSATWTCTLAVLRDRRPVAGFIANPMTAEVAYGLEGGHARCVRLGLFGEPSVAYELRPAQAREAATLVHLHPARSSEAVLHALHQAWVGGQIRMLRAAGGSPSWGLVEAARGRDVYVNIWDKRPAAPFDLAAGVLLVRSAGGDVTDLDDRPISAVDHAGPWIAGIDADQRARVAALVRDALRLEG